MDFSFSRDHEAFRRLLQDFATSELLPNYTRWDRERTFPRVMWRKLGELGVTGLRVAETYGGSDWDCVSAGIAAEEIGRGDFNLAYAVILHSLTGEILNQHATAELKTKWLPELASGEKVFGIAVTEPNAGSDAAAMRMKAERIDDRYILTGEKSGISAAAAADVLIVFAKTDAAARAQGISAFVVATDTPGLTVKRYEDMGTVPIARGSVVFNEVEIPVENRIGPENRGFYEVMDGFDLSRILIALQCIGAALQSLDETMAYVKTRQSFGRPLAKYQGVAFPIAEHYTKLQMVKWHCYRALWLRDAGRPHTMEAAMAKWMGPKLAVEAIHQCLLLNGHYGYTKDLPLEQRLRDTIGLEIGDGTAQTQQLIIARELLGKEFKPY
jgi:cyclohexanecarboxyl-CoA dehydrogenase